LFTVGCSDDNHDQVHFRRYVCVCIAFSRAFICFIVLSDSDNNVGGRVSFSPPESDRDIDMPMVIRSSRYVPFVAISHVLTRRLSTVVDLERCRVQSMAMYFDYQPHLSKIYSKHKLLYPATPAIPACMYVFKQHAIHSESLIFLLGVVVLAGWRQLHGMAIYLIC
jgi:hypothetical protein